MIFLYLQARISKMVDKYKASISGIINKDVSKKCNGVIVISVGSQPDQAGAKLIATLKKMNTLFKTTKIILADLLQAHTIQLVDSCSYEQACNKAENMKNIWLENNQAAFSIISNKYEIIFWKQWLSNPNYTETLKLVNDLYQTDQAFNSAINETIANFTNRLSSRIKNIDNKMAFSCCYNYLLEECAILLLWRNTDYHYLVYPNQLPKPMRILQQTFIQPKQNTLLKSAIVNFKKRKSIVSY